MAWSRGAVLALLTAVGVAGCASHSATRSDPPLFVPWIRIGDIALGEPRARVEQEYGSVGHGYHVLQRYGDTVQGYYRLHGTKVVVTFYGGRLGSSSAVGELEFSTPYYRTKSGFGVGSRIPLGRCHRTATNPCEQRWHGFIYNPTLREHPCKCWVKAGLGARSLPVDAYNFGKPWFFINLRRGHVAGFYFALKYVD